MIEKRCLIIDNEDQDSNIETIERLGKSNGIQIFCDQFNIGMPNRVDLLTENKIDITKVVNEFFRTYGQNTYHLVALDWDLGEDHIDGVELIRKFQENRILRHTPKILYSGLLKDKISSQLDGFKKKSTPDKNSLTIWINTLIRIDVRNFVDRTLYEQEIINQFLKTDETIDLILEELLKKFPTLRFQNNFVSKSFAGKTFGELSQILESEDRLRNEFKKEIVQQVLAYLTEAM